MEFFKYIKKRRKPKDNVGSFLNGRRTMVTQDEEKAELLNTFFTSVTTDKTSSDQGSGGRFLTLESKVKKYWSENSTWFQEDGVKGHLGKPDLSPWVLTSYIHEC